MLEILVAFVILVFIMVKIFEWCLEYVWACKSDVYHLNYLKFIKFIYVS